VDVWTGEIFRECEDCRSDLMRARHHQHRYVPGKTIRDRRDLAGTTPGQHETGAARHPVRRLLVLPT